MILTVQQVSMLLGRGKQTVSPMAWKPVRYRNTLEYRTSVAISSNGEIIESLRLLCVYTPMTIPMQDYYGFSVFFNNHRIYALDKENAFKQHANRLAGNGREHYGKIITGTHEHTWSAEGYGYAEPLNLGNHATHRDYWNYVSQQTNIRLTGGYSHPQEGDNGQMSIF
jgi:hypothetical protein